MLKVFFQIELKNKNNVKIKNLDLWCHFLKIGGLNCQKKKLLELRTITAIVN